MKVLQNNRAITIATSGNRFGPWRNESLQLSHFLNRIEQPTRTTEIYASYMALPKKAQDDLKDVGGFVGGTLNGTRKSGNVASRDLITLDIDKVEAAGTERVIRAAASLGAFYTAYSTRKHTSAAPRLRVIFPLSRSCSCDEYEPIARMVAKCMDPTMEMFDQTTFQAERLMYWPSCSADGEYLFQFQDAPFLDVDGVLAMYSDWRDVTAFPRTPYEQTAVQKMAEKQGDPTLKDGVVGAFCRVYDVYTALDTFLPGVYEPVNDGRYTYIGGSTTGGAIIYGDGLFLYSHHGTDPCCGHLVNAFDLVRLHKFGGEDSDVKVGTPVNKYPSYVAMASFVHHDEKVQAQLQQDQQNKIQADFGALVETLAPRMDAVEQGAAELTIQFGLDYDKNGLLRKTMHNAWSLLETDPVLQGKIILDVFSGKGIAQGPYPWDPDPKRRIWSDTDDNGVQWYLEKYYSFRSKMDVLAALGLCGNHHRIDPVKDYLNSLTGTWDRTPRLDTLFVDYLGALDSPYTRAVTRKTFTAAIARTYQPGCKFDTMLILAGDQGLGKSTLLNKMGGDWFTDNMESFEGKDAKDLIQGYWIIEIGELGNMNKAETNQVKQFLSQREDVYRAAYGRNTQSKPRRCVFFGTTNEYDYLKDQTGNRRFWPVDVGLQEACKSVFKDLNEYDIKQLWAEAIEYYRAGEPLYLTPELESYARTEQDKHRQVDGKEGIIVEYLNQLIPVDYENWTADRQQSWDAGVLQKAMADGNLKVDLAPRSRVCALEIWEKALHSDIRFAKQADTRFINGVIKAHGWKHCRRSFGKYGQQRGFERDT